jgi:hypothetical protein
VNAISACESGAERGERGVTFGRYTQTTRPKPPGLEPGTPSLQVAAETSGVLRPSWPSASPFAGCMRDEMLFASSTRAARAKAGRSHGDQKPQ